MKQKTSAWKGSRTLPFTNLFKNGVLGTSETNSRRCFGNALEALERVTKKWQNHFIISELPFQLFLQIHLLVYPMICRFETLKFRISVPSSYQVPPHMIFHSLRIVQTNIFVPVETSIIHTAKTYSFKIRTISRAPFPVMLLNRRIYGALTSEFFSILLHLLFSSILILSSLSRTISSAIR